MILPDHEIRKLLEEGRLVVEPLEDRDIQIQPAWIDLRLGNRFHIFKITSTPFIDTRTDSESQTEKLTVEDGDPFVIHPGEFILGSIKEYIKMPPDLMGVVDGRSSLGRLGIVIHSTSASINPGWEGEFVLEITNIGKMPVAVYPGQRIAKLVLHRLSSPAERPYNVRKEAKYNKEKDVTATKAHED